MVNRTLANTKKMAVPEPKGGLASQVRAPEAERVTEKARGPSDVPRTEGAGKNGAPIGPISRLTLRNI